METSPAAENVRVLTEKVPINTPKTPQEYRPAQNSDTRLGSPVNTAEDHEVEILTGNPIGNKSEVAKNRLAHGGRHEGDPARLIGADEPTSDKAKDPPNHNPAHIPVMVTTIHQARIVLGGRARRRWTGARQRSAIRCSGAAAEAERLVPNEPQTTTRADSDNNNQQTAEVRINQDTVETAYGQGRNGAGEHVQDGTDDNQPKEDMAEAQKAQELEGEKSTTERQAPQRGTAAFPGQSARQTTNGGEASVHESKVMILSHFQDYRTLRVTLLAPPGKGILH